MAARIDVLMEINQLLDNRCSGCPTRDELNRTYKSRFAQIDGYCNRQCPVGKQLQQLGKTILPHRKG